MKLLVTADLHFRLQWFRWLIEQAPDFDLICIAGDLLDMFRSETRMEQACGIRTLVKELADLVPVAVCSGNHDNAATTKKRAYAFTRSRSFPEVA
jgi:Icc-related predicted phosphoesterase